MIHFDPDTHTYTLPNGKILPSVTQIMALSGAGVPSGPTHAIANAGKRGTWVHHACALIDLGEPQPEPSEEYLPYVRAYEHWARDSCRVVVSTEVPMGCEELGYAGTPDLVCMVNGARWLIDRKSSHAVHKDVPVQLCAYKILWEREHPDEPIARMGALHLRKNGKYKLHEYRYDEHAGRWFDALNTWYDSPVAPIIDYSEYAYAME